MIYNSNNKYKIIFISGSFNPKVSGNIYQYGLYIPNCLAIVPMINQTNSDIYLYSPTYSSIYGWYSRCNSPAVDATISWIGMAAIKA